MSMARRPLLNAATLIAALGSGNLDVISNCGLVGEGVDMPGDRRCDLASPDRSLALYLQQIGRALRPRPARSPRFSTLPATRTPWPARRAARVVARRQAHVASASSRMVRGFDDARRARRKSP